MPESNWSLTAATEPAPADAPLLRRIATHLAGVAAAHVRDRRPEVFAGPGGAAEAAIRTKSTPTDPVTVVDTETEQLIRAELARLRPADHILGEEGGGDLAEVGTDEVVWVVDPIDGTVNFLYDLPAYAVSVAAVRNGRPVAGAVADIAASTLYAAGAGLGASRIGPAGTDSSLRCNPVRSTGLALVATGFGYEVQRRTRQAAAVADLMPHIRDIRRVGAAALDLCMVAEGRVDAHYEHGLNPWDWAAGALIAAEAGAVLRLPPMATRGAAGALVVAAAPGIAGELFELLDRLGVSAPIP